MWAFYPSVSAGMVDWLATIEGMGRVGET